MSDEIAIDRALLIDVEQFLLRLAGHAEVVRAVEQEMDCGDFYRHVTEGLARLTRPRPPAGGGLLRACREALDAADEPCGCDVVTVCPRCRRIAQARGLLAGGGTAGLEPRFRVRLRASRKGTCGEVLVVVPAGVVGTVEEAGPDGLTVVWDWAVVCGLVPGEEGSEVRRWWEEERVPVEDVEFAGAEA